MTRDEIYNHLAQVYLGKKNELEESARKKKETQRLNAWLVINFVITAVIFASAVYGLTAFLAHRSESLQSRVIYSLNRSPIRITYNLDYPYPPVESFALTISDIPVEKYKKLQFAVRGTDEGYPGMIRIEIRNKKSESASVFIDGIDKGWKNYTIPLDEFKQISDWENIEEISFILEAWNAQKKKGILLIDDVCFSS